MTFHISYPAELPVSERREDLMAAIAANQVTIIAGETGSGKTTQIPKMCLELGLGENGLIGHTQPRRLAARTVAERIAEELGVDIGQEVGFQVRFTGEVSRNTKVKLMTDGILLAEIQRDKLLRKYNAIIIDEAHERSLNIDFILGYLQADPAAAPGPEGHHHLGHHRSRAVRQALRHAEEQPAPIIEVSGRTFPVEIRYRPLVQPEDRPGRRGLRTMNSRRTATRWTRSATPWTNWPPRRPATSWCSSPASARSGTPPTRCKPGSSPTAGWRAPRSCRCSPG